MRFLLGVFLALVLCLPAHSKSRLKDIANLQDARENMLVGYGLVVGLQGTGDGLRNAPFTEQSMKAMLSRLGIAPGNRDARSKNIAAVIVTAKLPNFARPGARLDVTVSSIGDATSLRGGTLIMTPLRGADSEIYAAAQGALIVTGFQAEGQAESVTRGVPTVARVPNGAVVEKGLPTELGSVRMMHLQLRNPDFSTAVRVTDAINAFAESRYGMRAARELDSATIALRISSHVATATATRTWGRAQAMTASSAFCGSDSTTIATPSRTRHGTQPIRRQLRTSICCIRSGSGGAVERSTRPIFHCIATASVTMSSETSPLLLRTSPTRARLLVLRNSALRRTLRSMKPASIST